MHCAPGGGLARDKLFQLGGKFHGGCAVRQMRVRVYDGRCLGRDRFASAPPRWYHGVATSTGAWEALPLPVVYPA